MDTARRLAALRHRIERRPSAVVASLVLAAVAAVLAVVAYRLLFSAFDVPDDTGYVLMTIRKFDDGGALYHGVYSQFGPGVPVLVGGAFRVLGVAPTIEAALVWNWVMWVGAAVFVGFALLRLTRRLAIAGLGLVLAFLVLHVDANEPLHPGATIAFMLAAIVLVAAFGPSRLPRASFAAIGALAAAILSLKVNVGLFAMLSIAFALAWSAPKPRRPVVLLRALLAVALVAISFAVLGADLDTSWGLQFAAMVALGSLGLVAVATRARPAAEVGARTTLATIGGALAVFLLVALIPIANGTSPGDLLDGWLLRPTGTAELAHAALLIDGRGWLWAAAGLVLALFASRHLDRRPSPRLAAAVGFGRLFVGLVMWAGVAGPVLGLSPTLTQGLVAGAPFLWVAAARPPAEGSADGFARLLIPALAALQFLHAYPMPGSQLDWSVLLLVPVGGLCIADGADEIAALAVDWRSAAGRALRLAPGLAMVVFAIWIVAKPLRYEARLAYYRYRQSAPLDLTGTGGLRLNPPLARQLQGLVAGARRHCDTFLTYPGMNSLNLMAGLEPPVELSSPWPFFFSRAEQRDIVRQVRSLPRLCLIHKPDLVTFWSVYAGRPPPQRPLVRFLEDGFREVHDYEGYVLLARKRG